MSNDPSSAIPHILRCNYDIDDSKDHFKEEIHSTSSRWLSTLLSAASKLLSKNERQCSLVPALAFTPYLLQCHIQVHHSILAACKQPSQRLAVSGCRISLSPRPHSGRSPICRESAIRLSPRASHRRTVEQLMGSRERNINMNCRAC